MIKQQCHILISLLVGVMSLCSCSDDDEALTDIIVPSAEGTFTDARDGNTYRWVRYGNLEWMEDNLRYNLNDENKCRLYVMDDKTIRIDDTRYGRIYTNQGASKAVPEGWRLPTDEDWKNLEMTMGMSASDANKTDWRGNMAKRMVSMYDTTTPINILLAGYYTPNMIMSMTGYRFFSQKGYYWTSSTDTEKGNGFYYFREFMFNQQGVRRESTSDDFLMSVKCVRDVE